ncbi:MAG: hypothetical protein ACOX3G_04315 [Armatimonadota bacterium]|jgi:hypothetical protein
MAMRKEEIRLEDGRYLIYFTFDDEEVEDSSDERECDGGRD